MFWEIVDEIMHNTSVFVAVFQFILLLSLKKGNPNFDENLSGWREVPKVFGSDQKWLMSSGRKVQPHLATKLLWKLPKIFLSMGRTNQWRNSVDRNNPNFFASCANFWACQFCLSTCLCLPFSLSLPLPLYLSYSHFLSLSLSLSHSLRRSLVLSLFFPQ